MSDAFAAIILAAGKGTRLGLTDRPKPMAEINAQETAISLLIQTIKKANIDTIVVTVGHKKKILQKYLATIDCRILTATQQELNGTLGATLVGYEMIKKREVKDIVIFPGDNGMFLTTKTLKVLTKIHRNNEACLTVLLTQDFNSLTHKIYFTVQNNKIIEQKMTINEDVFHSEMYFNTGIICVETNFLVKYALKVTELPNKELTVTRLIEIALKNDIPVYYSLAEPNEIVSINRPEDLEKARKRPLAANS